MILKLGLGLAAVALALVAGGLLGNRPPLFSEPGVGARLKTYFTSNVARTDPDSPFPELRPRRYAVAPERLRDLAAQACVELGWTTRLGDGGALHAEITTPTLRFTDDLVARALPDGDGARLELESRSRFGRADLGANLRHVIDLHEALGRLVEPLPDRDP